MVDIPQREVVFTLDGGIVMPDNCRLEWIHVFPLVFCSTNGRGYGDYRGCEYTPQKNLCAVGNDVGLDSRDVEEDRIFPGRVR